ncbi:polysaccharide pyruvyl transferase family protein, partial [Vibrio alfacsensis]|uniref:polysaccharide pyruvyl transferase family protein n=1 Tax=Vibrio alfacsensis TaxID=1074311 RepID=UPI0040676037
MLDPVFLKKESEWKVLIKSRPLSERYILIYIMEYNHGLLQLAQKLAKKSGKKIFIISPNSNIKTVLKSYNLPGKVFFTKGPEEYLDLIYHADYICTNSFHGTAFSIIFKKDFITVPHGTRNT